MGEGHYRREFLHKLEVKDVVNSYGGLLVLDGISLAADAGGFVGVVGPSGCGKSTLLNVICGLLPADGGEILVDGARVVLSQSIAYMPQDDLLMPWRSAADNAALPLIIAGVNKAEAREEARSYFEAFGLSGFEKAYPDELSGGMRQRLALLRTVLCKKDILLLDEPFGALDALTRIRMQDWLRELLTKLSRTVVMVTHDIDEALYLSDEIVVLSALPARVALRVRTPSERGRDWLRRGSAPLHAQIYEALRRKRNDDKI